MDSSVVFLQTHIDFFMENRGINDQEPVFTIFGSKKDGTPVQVYVRNFLPYFYVKPIYLTEIDPEQLLDAINNLNIKGKAVKVEEKMAKSIYGYEESNSKFYKISFNTPHVFTPLKPILEGGIVIEGEKVCFSLYESNFPFVLRFMIDLNISGMSYLKVDDYKTLNYDPLVLSTSYENIDALELLGEYNSLPRFKILSIDIECISLSDGFPTASKDPIIQIGNTVVYSDGYENFRQDIFVLKDTSGIPGANVHCFENEDEMMLAWRDYFLKEDPDIVIGYNIKGFDIPYIIDRAETLRLKGFNVLGRTKKAVKPKESVFSSRAFGSIAMFDVSFDGRMIFDLMQIIRRDYKLRSYSLNSVSLHFLGEQKEDVHHTQMHELQNKDRDTRKRIASYCLKDTVLPIRLFKHLDVLVNYTELARVTGVPIEYFSTRGTSVKILTLIYREARKREYLIPVLDVVDNDVTYEGGYVMDPLKGYYDNPIAVLDFTSLYPSIMISNNLCYTTLLSKEQYDKLGGIRTPTNNYFAKPDVRQGLLPTVLVELLKSRSETKKAMKNETDPNLKSCLNGRQLAIKIVANSIYGFTGATIGKLPCIEISQSVTSFGREMIAYTKKIIEETYKRKNGFSEDLKVIYGDTDSVMINFEETDIHKIFDMAKEISVFVTSKFSKPISIDFEKVYFPYLLINKKRYAGLIYTSPDKPSKIDTKGIETVRRDNCGLVKTVIETCLDLILYKRDTEGAKSYVKNVVRDLYLGKFDLSQLVISKALTKKGDLYASKQAHVELAKKIKKRGDEVSTNIGDRIAYVIIDKGKKVAAYEKAEDPVYVLENNLPIDTTYYIEQQLSKPLHRLFEPIMDNVSELLMGEHTRVVSKPVSMKGPLNAFFKVSVSCLGCKKTGVILCKSCRPNYYKYFKNLNTEIENKKEQYHACWTECQRCQGSLFNDVICINRDCPIFYMRTRVKKELESMDKKLINLRNLEW